MSFHCAGENIEHSNNDHNNTAEENDYDDGKNDDDDTKLLLKRENVIVPLGKLELHDNTNDNKHFNNNDSEEITHDFLNNDTNKNLTLSQLQSSSSSYENKDIIERRNAYEVKITNNTKHSNNNTSMHPIMSFDAFITKLSQTQK